MELRRIGRLRPGWPSGPGRLTLVFTFEAVFANNHSPGLDVDDLQGNAIDLDLGVAYCHAKLAKPAETLVLLATDPEGARDPGRYFHNPHSAERDERRLVHRKY